MISKYDHIRRQTCADLLITDIIKQSLEDNAIRIPFTNKGGFISTEMGENDDDEHIVISIHGFQDQFGMMMQTVTIIYFETLDQAKHFLNSPEGYGFSNANSNAQDCFEYTTYAGDPRLPNRITEILKNHFGFKDNSRLVAETHCEVDYFI